MNLLLPADLSCLPFSCDLRAYVLWAGEVLQQHGRVKELHALRDHLHQLLVRTSLSDVCAHRCSSSAGVLACVQENSAATMLAMIGTFLGPEMQPPVLKAFLPLARSGPRPPAGRRSHAGSVVRSPEVFAGHMCAPDTLHLLSLQGENAAAHGSGSFGATQGCGRLDALAFAAAMAQAASASSEGAEADVSAAGEPAALQCLAAGVQQELPHPCGGAMAQQVASAMAPPMPALPPLPPPAPRPGPRTRSQGRGGGRGLPKAAADLQQHTLGTHPAVALMHQQQAQGHRTLQQQVGLQ